MHENRKAELESKWKKVATLAITDPEFKKQLVKDPITVLNMHGLTLPQGVQARQGGEMNEISLLIPPKAEPEIEQETKWWKRRLDMIRQFGIEDKEQKPMETIPDSTGDDV